MEILPRQPIEKVDLRFDREELRVVLEGLRLLVADGDDRHAVLETQEFLEDVARARNWPI